VLSATGATINGNWEVKLQQPEVNDNPSPSPMASACVTLEKWQQVLKDPVAIPVDLSQRILVNRGALVPQPSLFITNLDGSGEQGLVFGNGSLSENGSTLVYSDNAGNIKVRDVATGNETVLTHDQDDNNPIFSPDGSQIAFTRRGDDQQIFVMNADGSEVKLVVPGGNYPQAWGWTPDGGQILFWTKASERSSLIQLADPLSGENTPLLRLTPHHRSLQFRQMESGLHILIAYLAACLTVCSWLSLMALTNGCLFSWITGRWSAE
jgi:WD40 repeat protein